MNKQIVFFLAFIFSVSVFAQNQFKTHQVKEGETIESIAKQYRVTPYAILKLNPEAKTGVRKNTVLIIPSSSTVENDQNFQEKVTFITHKVRKKETLFSISKRYNVKVEDIKRYNKELYSRQLDKGEKIRIPQIQYLAVQEEADSIPDGLVEYVVKPKEGKWRIAYEHGISVPELEKLNPDMGEVLKDGDEILVPDIHQDSVKTVDNLNYNYYVVQPREGFFRLKVKFGLEKDSVLALNPEAQDGLKAGMILKLPKETFGAYNVQEDGKLMPKFTLTDSINSQLISKIAVAIPLKLNEIDFESSNDARKKLEADRLLNISLDFYSGMLVAIDSVKKLGVNADIKILDTEGTEVGVSKLLNNTDFTAYNAVIGPFTYRSFNKLSYGLRRHNVPVFAPFTNKNIELYQNVFQTLPSDEVLVDKMIDFIVEKGQDKHIIIIADSKNAIVKNKLKAGIPSASIVTTESDNYVKMVNLERSLSKEKENWVVVESNRIPLLTNIANVLNSLRTDRRKIVMFTTNKGDAYETSDDIKNSYLSALQFHYPTVDKPSSLDNTFHKVYEERFGSYPNRYAIRGFDLMMDILLRLSYNKDLYRVASRVGETEYLENKFAYKKQYAGGYMNTGVYIVKYDNLEIKEVK